MKRALGLAFLVLLFLWGCRRHTPTSDQPAALEEKVSAKKSVVDEGCPHMVDGTCAHELEAPAAQGAPEGRGHFGKPLGASPQVELAAILAAPQSFHEKKVLVDGHVTRACSRKGCWMEVAVDKSPDAPRCRVTFENYGFFVPKDSAGSHARLEGTVQVTEVKAGAVEHYESEGAKFAGKHADGSAREVRLVATGVELERI